MIKQYTNPNTPNIMNSEYPQGTKVKIHPRWLDAGEEGQVFVVVTPDEGFGRVDITPEFSTSTFPGWELVQTFMLEKI